MRSHSLSSHTFQPCRGQTEDLFSEYFNSIITQQKSRWGMSTMTELCREAGL